MVSEDLQHVPVQLNVFWTSWRSHGSLDEGLILIHTSMVNDGVRIMVAVLTAMCSWQNFSHSSKVMTPVDFRSMESNIFCLATSFSASVLYKAESSGAYP